MEHGAKVIIDTKKRDIRDVAGKVIAEFSMLPAIIPDAYRAGGMVSLLIGKKLTQRAREVLHMKSYTIFIRPENMQKKEGKSFTLAQKIIGRACGERGVLPGESCEPKVSIVGSQDATGVMTCDELTELACLKFQAPLVLQSFCHTAACPKDSDLVMHNTLANYFQKRGALP